MYTWFGELIIENIAYHILFIDIVIVLLCIWVLVKKGRFLNTELKIILAILSVTFFVCVLYNAVSLCI